MAKDEMEWAFTTCWRSAGDDVNDFIGATSDDPVSPERSSQVRGFRLRSRRPKSLENAHRSGAPAPKKEAKADAQGTHEARP